MANAKDATEQSILSGFRLKLGDIFVILFVIGFGFVAFFSRNRIHSGGLTYRVYVSGNEVGRGYLERDTTFSVKGLIGETVIDVEGGSVRVVSSACKDKICVKTGRINKPGSIIACVPNGVIIIINGDAKVESITY